MTTFAGANGHGAAAYVSLASMMQHPPILFREVPGLAGHLVQAKICGPVRDIPTDSPLLVLRRLLTETSPPNSVYLLVSESGETTAKTELLRKAFLPLIESAPSFSGRVWHLMCFAGSDDDGRPVLLNVPKPAFENDSRSPFLLKTGDGGEGHLVLNQQIAAHELGGFSPLTEESVSRVTGGMARHGVNFLISSDYYDAQIDLRAVFCGSFVEMYLDQPGYRIHLVEVPLADQGDRYSVIVPVELFLAYLVKLRSVFPHIELRGYEELAEATLRATMGVLTDLLRPESLDRILSYNGKRPMMAGFNAFVGQLARALKERLPYTSDHTARAIITNFVRHFFAVEHGLVEQALAVEDETALTALYERLKRTEYGKFLLPCGSFEEFASKLAEERKKKQPDIPFEFSSEVAKSSLYLTWLERMSAKLRHHVCAVARQGVVGLDGVLHALEARLLADCARQSPGADPLSLQSAVRDFIEIIFGRHRLLWSMIQKKLPMVIDPEASVDEATKAYWTDYWRSTMAMLRESSTGVDSANLKLEVGRRALAPDLLLLDSLPYTRELGLGAAIRKLLFDSE